MGISREELLYYFKEKSILNLEDLIGILEEKFKVELFVVDNKEDEEDQELLAQWKESREDMERGRFYEGNQALQRLKELHGYYEKI